MPIWEQPTKIPFPSVSRRSMAPNDVTPSLGDPSHSPIERQKHSACSSYRSYPHDQGGCSPCLWAQAPSWLPHGKEELVRGNPTMSYPRNQGRLRCLRRGVWTVGYMASSSPAAVSAVIDTIMRPKDRKGKKKINFLAIW